MARESIWVRPESAGVGRRPEHSRAEIAAAAIRIADAEGLAAVTMRRVAAEIDTGAASLYRYVHTRDELLDLMVDAAEAELDLARPFASWRAGVEDLLGQGLDMLRTRPWISEVMLSGMAVPGPNSARLSERFLEILDEHPAPGSLKMAAVGVVNGMLFMIAQQEARAESPDWMEAYAGAMAAIAATGEFPRLAAAFAEPPQEHSQPQDAFMFLAMRALAGILDGPGEGQ